MALERRDWKRFFGANGNGKEPPGPVYNSPFKDYAGPADIYIDDDEFPDLIANKKPYETIEDLEGHSDDDEILDTEEDDTLSVQNNPEFSKLRLRLYEDDFESLRRSDGGGVEDSDEDLVDYEYKVPRTNSNNDQIGSGIYTITTEQNRDLNGGVCAEYQSYSINNGDHDKDDDQGLRGYLNRMISVVTDCLRSVQEQIGTQYDRIQNNNRAQLLQSEPSRLNQIV